MWISFSFLKTHLGRRRVAAGARAKPAQPGRRVRFDAADPCGGRRLGGIAHIQFVFVLIGGSASCISSVVSRWRRGLKAKRACSLQ
jgi:hypothetical protein